MAETAYPGIATLEREAPAAAATVPFSELVHAHFLWRAAVARGAGAAEEATYRRLLAQFESVHGQIVSSYWCSNVESAVALTEKRQTWPLRLLAGPQLAFHRVSDWATRGQPDVARQLHACDELAVRATHVLTGLRRRVCMQLVAAGASHLLSLVDARAAHEDSQKAQAALAQETTELEDVRAYYREAANGQAQIVYFFGMAFAATLLCGGLACGLWITVGERWLFAGLIAGAIGAVISVIQRINARSFEIEYDVGRLYVLFLGSLRPAIGGVFGMAIALAVSSDILKLPGVPAGGAELGPLLVVSFFAGFSERWAQDTLAAALPVEAPKPKRSANGTGAGAP